MGNFYVEAPEGGTIFKSLYKNGGNGMIGIHAFPERFIIGFCLVFLFGVLIGLGIAYLI